MAGSTTLIDLIESGYSFGEDLFFGHRSSCSAEQKEARKQLAQDIETYLTPQDMEELTQGMQDRVDPTPQAMAYFAMGEADCKHKNVGERHQEFINALPQRIQQRKQEAQENTGLPGMGLPSGSGGQQFQTAGFGLPAIILMVLAIGGIAWVSK